MKILPFTREQIAQIDEEYGTPFHIYDEEALRVRVRTLQSAFAWNENYREYYAVKACPNPAIMRILKEENCGMDCSSYAELMLSEAAGIVGDNIMFSSNATPAKDFEYARRLGATINLDDITHIDFLKAHGGIPQTISCRFNPGGEFRLGNTIMGNPSEAKYGFTKAQLLSGWKYLMELGATRFGLHAFLASNTTDNSYYPALAGLLFDVAAELHAALGCEVAFINLSGGIGIPYKPGDKPADIAQIGSGVQREYERVFGKTNMRPAIFTELGRYVTGPIGTLVTKAVHHKNTYRQFIGCDACAVDLMRPAMYGAYHEITVLGKENAERDHVYDITGSLCENNDKFAVDRRLPRIDLGDYIAIHDTGAHGFSMGYNYNGKLKSKELLLRSDGSAEEIRRAETVLDYLATLEDDKAAFKSITLRNATGGNLPNKISLAALPTPLAEMKNAGAALKRKLYVKRDDMTGISLGGNKVRKLEYLLCDAIASGADVVLTTGAAQSNHAMLTAACCNKLGLKSILVLKQRGVMDKKGNQLLNSLLSTDVRYVNSEDYADVYAEMERIAAELIKSGHRPYIIPLGGSVPLGTLGYVEAAIESISQGKAAGISFERIVCCAGSGGTLAGLMLGAALCNSKIKVTGIDIGGGDFEPIVATLFNSTAKLIGRGDIAITQSDVHIHPCFGAGYAIPSKEGLNAIRFMAQHEGIMLDPVYTGKTFAGLMQLIESGIIAKDESVLFVHTGGAASLFAIDPEEIF